MDWTISWRVGGLRLSSKTNTAEMLPKSRHSERGGEGENERGRERETGRESERQGEGESVAAAASDVEMSYWIYWCGHLGRSFTSKFHPLCLSSVWLSSGRSSSRRLPLTGGCGCTHRTATKENKRRKDGWKDELHQNKKSLAKAALIIAGHGALSAIATQAEEDRGGWDKDEGR